MWGGRGTCSGDSQTKLAHRVESWRTPIEELFDELRNCGASGPVFGQLGNLFWSGNFSGQQEPKKTLG